MKLEEIEEMRNQLLAFSEEELIDMDVDDLHHELYDLTVKKEDLESSKKIFSQRSNESLKLLKARLLKVTQLIEESSGNRNQPFPAS